ncbi:hypothetical protein ACFFGH_33640 [Lysobacter korlensis]|uniref:Uncharacterized protein n=1 Tax=Lysobacter korlensis TaxID=553636 RepID=A0ABV6S0P7_9GAMM
MPTPDLSTPVVADVAAFGGGDAGKAAKINYNVPLPGAYSWQRVVPLEIDRSDFVEQAFKIGDSLLKLKVVTGDQGVLTGIDAGRLAKFIRQALPAPARPSLRLVAEVGADVQPLLSELNPQPLPPQDLDRVRFALRDRRAVMAEPEDVEVQRLRIDSYIDRLAKFQVETLVEDALPKLILPLPGIGNSIRHVPINPVAPIYPRLALVETWELRSFLGDYGLGRTLQTFSLLPGERTTITVHTWRTEAATREDATSIFDSSDTAAQTRFTDALQRASGTASQESGGWGVSVSTSVSAGASFFGLVSASASVSAGFAANHQESSQRFSSRASQSASEHASQVNNSRRQAVESTSATQTAAGVETTTVREIANTNLRRVLNFVFRELNQSYDTYVVLRDIQVAFYNGNAGSAEIVPLPELGRLLEKHVKEPSRDRVAQQLLTLAAQRFDAFSEVVTTLQVGRNPRGIKYDWQDAELDDDGLVAGPWLGPDVRWRFKQEPLSHDPAEGSPSIPGVIMDKSAVTLRTDNLVVEALLGQADALDPYASSVQALDLMDRQARLDDRLATTRVTTDRLDLVAAQPDPEKVTAFERLFPDEPEIQVVSTSALTNGAHPPQQ